MSLSGFSILIFSILMLFSTDTSARISKRDVKWTSTILPALTHYKQLYGNTLIPYRFVVPADWPTSQGLKLGTLAETIRRKKAWNHKREDLTLLGFEFRPIDDIKFDAIIFPSLVIYKQIHNNLLVPQDFTVPCHLPWPSEAYTYPLGNAVMSIRSSNAWRKKRKILEEIGFVFSTVKDIKWETEILPALKCYKDFKGHLRVPLNFIVPVSELWPKSCHGCKLGVITNMIRSRGQWSEKHQTLIDLGFDFRSVSDARWYDKILPAFLAYREVYGDLLVPASFVVPSISPWPPQTHGLHLGNIASHIRNMGEWSTKHGELEDIGFKFGDVLEAIWKTEIYPAFQCFKDIYGHLRIPMEFVVPKEAVWPELSYGLHLGGIVKTIREHGVWGDRITKLEELGLEVVQNTFIDWISGTKIEEQFYNLE